MARNYVEIELDHPRKLKFKMRTVGEAEQFLPKKFVEYFMSPEARRALGAESAGVDLTDDDLRLVRDMAEGGTDEALAGALGKEKFEALSRRSMGVFGFFGHTEVLTLFWAGLIHEDPKLTQSQVENLIEEHVPGASEFQKFSRVLYWVIQGAMLYFGGGEKKGLAAPSAPKSGSTGTGAA